ncbi:AI-2E family transporter [Diaphorobacter sp. HDW4B]|uniref:AI-2E family transporter n=1 Tax=Diaphorobacter sp. HDW4B TaxID=2714925 RepID=UPI00140C1818|nr:AI-2E family transporter [Diaphorobacter sp. HDW4B]QIL72940.1 AI-2E family transporter [Diaphorobacter sp. HDW4B]
MKSQTLQQRTFLLILISVTLAFFGILWPYAFAVFWGVVLAILFAPLQKWLLQRMPKRKNWAALITLSVCLLLVILPLLLIVTSLVTEAGAIYERLKSGQLNVGSYLQTVSKALPAWAMQLLDHFHLTSMAEIEDRLSKFGAQASQFLATKAVDVGSNTLQFVVGFGVMLYLLFFLLRDGSQLAARIRDAVPLDPMHKRKLAAKFTTVIRATVKGNIAVAAVQGALGGLIFWILGIQGPVLWGVIMAFLSLLPAVGAALIWAPVAIYFFATGATWQGVVLVAFCAGIIGSVDNILRPLLVGKDTKLPDYVVLISTLGGMAIFGISGFVIGPMVAALFNAVWDLFSPPAGDEENEGTTATEISALENNSVNK